MSKPINKEIIMCPNCKQSKFEFTIDKIYCDSCGGIFNIENYGDFENYKVYFTEHGEKDVLDFFDKVKYRLKKFSKFYNFLINLISPVYPLNLGLNKFIKNILSAKILSHLI